MSTPFREFVEQHAYHAKRDPDMDTKPVTVRLPLDRIAQIDFLASELKIPRQALMEEMIEEGIRGVLAAYIPFYSAGPDKLYEEFTRVGDQALGGQLKETTND